ncbi:Phosphoenolpyruvate carboxylase [Candidatus Anstonella stagnisolia]|nr:Phosphoenolpyruvate carboxylase [Candidatus Anstonella stagnisolia]
MQNPPRCMSTQHPDNVNTPFFSEGEVLAGENEIKEAYYVFSHLGIPEQMWDYEGKEVDNHVVEKLLARYPKFFAQNNIGKDVRLTLRVPNPAVQKGQGKLLLETLESIPRNFDIAQMCGQQGAPIWEVILPMTTSAQELVRISEYYGKIVVGKAEMRVGSASVQEWIGKFAPEKISIIPLVENKEALLNAHNIAGEYAASQKLEGMRVFLARSDPALNYGAASAVLLVKIALMQMQEMGEKNSLEVYPIIGVGSAPFRGNLKPTNVGNCMGEYPSVQTFTLQSSFKYDYDEKNVRDSVEGLNASKRGKALFVDKEKALGIVDKLTGAYQQDVAALSPIIGMLSKYAPQRRARKLHIGLFGYSRSLQGISLPRAIPFCAALYSIGVPPELLGLGALDGKGVEQLREVYVKIDEDIKDSAQYLNMRNVEKLPAAVRERIGRALDIFGIKEGADLEYSQVSTEIWETLHSENKAPLYELIAKAAWKRNFLG